MSLSLITYLSFLVLAFIFSLLVFKKKSYIRLFIFLLEISILTELTAIIIYRVDNSQNYYNIPYNIYVLFDYLLTILILSNFIISSKLRKIAIGTIPLFLLISLWLSFHNSFLSDPGINLNIAGVIYILIIFYILFNLPITEEKSIFKMPVFWFCLGWLIYIGGTFFFNFWYEYLLERQESLADELHRWIIRSFNCFMYISFIIGFICLKRNRK